MVAAGAAQAARMNEDVDSPPGGLGWAGWCWALLLTAALGGWLYLRYQPVLTLQGLAGLVVDGARAAAAAWDFWRAASAVEIAQLPWTFGAVAVLASAALIGTLLRAARRRRAYERRCAQQAGLALSELRAALGELNADGEVGGSRRQEVATEQLREGTRGIDEIIELLEAAAEQSSLWSLNASIHAAVVAEGGDGAAAAAQARRLAERATQSAAEITARVRILERRAAVARAALVGGQTMPAATATLEKIDAATRKLAHSTALASPAGAVERGFAPQFSSRQ